MARGNSPGTAEEGDHWQPDSPVATLQGDGREAVQMAGGNTLSASEYTGHRSDPIAASQSPTGWSAGMSSVFEERGKIPAFFTDFII